MEGLNQRMLQLQDVKPQVLQLLRQQKPHEHIVRERMLHLQIMFRYVFQKSHETVLSRYTIARFQRVPCCPSGI